MVMVMGTPHFSFLHTLVVTDDIARNDIGNDSTAVMSGKN